MSLNKLLAKAAERRKGMMVVLRKRGWSDSAIALKYGITRQRVHKILGAKK